MTYPIRTIEDIDSDDAAALRSIGIRTTEKLLEAAKGPKGRKLLASRTKLDEKTLFGHKGRWQGDDLVRLLLEHPATARRLAWRLCDALMGEGAVGPAALDAPPDPRLPRDRGRRAALRAPLADRAFG